CHGRAGQGQGAAGGWPRCHSHGDRGAGFRYPRAHHASGPGGVERRAYQLHPGTGAAGAARGHRRLLSATLRGRPGPAAGDHHPGRLRCAAAGQRVAGGCRQQGTDGGPRLPCNRHFMRLVEGAAKLIPTGPESAYQLTPELIEQHWDADSAAVLSASPANPSGSVLSRAQLQGLAQVTAGLGGELIVDEIYHGLTYGCDAASVLEVAPDAWVLNSFSKYFGMTGWRLGWLIAPLDAVPE